MRDKEWLNRWADIIWLLAVEDEVCFRISDEAEVVLSSVSRFWGWDRGYRADFLY